ncbi:hypothetical protein GQ42DRAFT_143384 [Ramicandelaber brevisporus]|nr:hypothetical protein GQ42DRAFT_143384 [Ramicandelaber brevisporus]
MGVGHSQMMPMVSAATLAANLTTIAGTSSSPFEPSSGEDLTYDKSLGSTRLIKTIRARHGDDEGLVTIKIFIKPASGAGTGAGAGAAEEVSYSSVVQYMKTESSSLANVSNALGYARIVETERSVYMIRQYIYSNLYDRISTRPFLTICEKLWIAYQLVSTLSDCHRNGVVHGDIKSENVLITTWGWIYLTDFASFKPVCLPSDNPADYSFFFDTSSRHACYLAPERFYDSSTVNAVSQPLTPAMDIFSLGCVLMELFLDGSPLFTLARLLQYRSNSLNITESIEAVSHPGMRALLDKMLKRDPNERPTASECLDILQSDNIQNSFDTKKLHEYLASSTVANHIRNRPGTRTSSAPTTVSRQQQQQQQHSSQPYSTVLRNTHAVSSVGASIGGSGGSSGGSGGSGVPLETELAQARGGKVMRGFDDFIMQLDSDCGTLISSYKSRSTALPGLCTILGVIISSSAANCVTPIARCTALSLLGRISEYLPAHVILDRLVPRVCSLLSDSVPIVRVTAINVLIHVIDQIVTKIQSEDEESSDHNSIGGFDIGRLFAEYIFPQIQPLVHDTSHMVRLTLASNLTSLVRLGLRAMQLADQRDSPADEGYFGLFIASARAGGHDESSNEVDNPRIQLLNSAQNIVVQLLTDSHVEVRRAVVASTPQIGALLGRQRTTDALLLHLITLMNGRDWALRGAFFDAAPGLGVVIGAQAVSEYILPLVPLALVDPEEHVHAAALRALRALTGLGLLSRKTTWELMNTVPSMLIHPNAWISRGALCLISEIVEQMPMVDVWCVAYQALHPYLRADVVNLDTHSIAQVLHQPLRRRIFNDAVAHLISSPSSISQLSSPSSATSTHQPSLSTSARLTRRASSATAVSGLPLTAGGHRHIDWRSIVRTASESDVAKLTQLADYIVRISAHRSNSTKSDRNRQDQQRSNSSSESISLQSRNVPIHSHFVARSHLDDFKNSRQPSSFNSTSTSAERSNNINHTDYAPQRTPHMRSPSVPRSVSASSSSNRSSIDYQHSRDFAGHSPRSDTFLYGRDNRDSDVWGGSESTHLRPATSLFGRPSSPMSHHRSRAEVASTIASGSIASDLLTQANRKASLSTAVVTEHVTIGHGSKSPTAVSPAPAVEPPQSLSRSTSSRTDGTADPVGIQALLRERARELYPWNLPELGPSCHSDADYSGKSRRESTSYPRHTTSVGAEPSANLSSWRPNGILVASMPAHSASVSSISLTSDDSLCATCGEDGTVRFYDMTALDRRAIQRATAVFQQQGRIRSSAFIGDTFSLATCADDGSIRILRFNWPSSIIGGTGTGSGGGGDANQGVLGSVHQLRQTQLRDGEYAVSILSLQGSAPLTSREPLLALVTQLGNIILMSVRSLDVLWLAQSPPRFGSITAMVASQDGSWLVTGTSHGVLTLWDLRFRIAVRSWRLPHPTRVRALSRYDGSHPPQSSRGSYPASTISSRTATNIGGTSNTSSTAESAISKYVLVATDRNEILLYDISTAECLEVYQAGRSSSSTASAVRQSLLADASKYLESTVIKPTDHSTDADDTSSIVDDITALVLSADVASNEQTQRGDGSHSNSAVNAISLPATVNGGGWFVSGGNDCSVRIWDMVSPDMSFIMVGNATLTATGGIASTANVTSMALGTSVIGNEDQNNQRVYTSFKVGRVQFHCECAIQKRSQDGAMVDNTKGGPSVLAQHTRSKRKNLAHPKDAITAIKVSHMPFPVIIVGMHDGSVAVYS